MKRYITLLILVTIIASQSLAQWQIAAVALSRKLAVKGLETCVTLLVGRGIEKCFDGTGKPDLSALDARLRAVEGIVGPSAAPLTEVRARIGTETTARTTLNKSKQHYSRLMTFSNAILTK